MNIVKQYYAGLTALIVFLIYFTTMASTVIHLDAGELAAVQSTLGIAHPTGFKASFPFQSD
jgi:tRNA(Phe) wybutosine-synthesizing methylase Tyw3